MRRYLTVFFLALSLVLFVIPTAPARKSETNDHEDAIFTTIDFPDAIDTQSGDVNGAGEIGGDT